MEFLNSMTFSGIPNHGLKFKVVSAVMLQHNINQSAGFRNGTRITNTQLENKYTEARIITGTHVDHHVTKQHEVAVCAEKKTLLVSLP